MALAESPSGAAAAVVASRRGGQRRHLFPQFRVPQRFNPFAGKEWGLFPRRLFAIVMTLFVIGFICIWSASQRPTPSGEIVDAGYHWKQLLWCTIGLIAMYVLVRVPYLKIARTALIWYLLGFVLLVVVWKFGATVNGAKRWIRFPGVDFLLQPSELVKLAVIIAIAQYLRFKKNTNRWSGLVMPAVIVAIPVVTPAIGILFQPDLGTSLSFAPIVIGMLIAAGIRLHHLLTIVLGMIGLVPVAILGGFLKEYQIQRLTAFLDPEAHIRDIGYQVVQSKTAIGAGGVTGTGPGEGTHNALGYLPENHTDFIFAVIGEEWGFVGCCVVVLLYVVLLGGMLHIAYRTREPAGRLIVVGIAMMFTYQVFENIGMTIGLSPCTGLTLPFVSYGGSSLLANFMALAMVMNVAMHPSRDLA